MATLNISMPDAMRNWIDGQVRSGKYANASDYMRDLIRHDQRECEFLAQALRAGEQSGRSKRKVSAIKRQTKRELETTSLRADKRSL